MALAEIDRAIAAGVRFGCVLADAGYGLSAPFRQGLTARKLAWAVGIPRHLKVYPADVRMIWPVAKRGRPADQGQGPTTSARRRGLAHRRTQDVGREEVLSRQPASEDRPAHLSNHHQGALGLRAGSPADERRTWS